jgi:hypothetical protein
LHMAMGGGALGGATVTGGALHVRVGGRHYRGGPRQRATSTFRIVVERFRLASCSDGLIHHILRSYHEVFAASACNELQIRKIVKRNLCLVIDDLRAKTDRYACSGQFPVLLMALSESFAGREKPAFICRLSAGSLLLAGGIA